MKKVLILIIMLSMMIVSCQVNAQEVDARDNYPYPIDEPEELAFNIEDVSFCAYVAEEDQYIIEYTGFGDWDNYNYLNHSEEEYWDFIQIVVDKTTYEEVIDALQEVKSNYDKVFDYIDTWVLLEYYNTNTKHFYYRLEKRESL